MKLIMTLIFLVCTVNVFSAENFYDLKAKKIDGDTLYFSELKGKKLMIVNVASYCGYTYQYADLQSLYKQYGGDKFEIIGFPANNFSNQEPGSDSSIYEFCTDKYNVTFTMMSKISVLGSDKHPVYQWLTLKSKNGVADQEVLWNFQKYLVNEFGQLVGIYGTQTSPLAKEIVDWVKQGNTSISEQENQFQISPNPATDFITVDVSFLRMQESASDLSFLRMQESEIKIYNIFGECVLTVETQNFVSLQKIDISTLPDGVYFVKFGDEVRKFVVVR